MNGSCPACPAHWALAEFSLRAAGHISLRQLESRNPSFERGRLQLDAAAFRRPSTAGYFVSGRKNSSHSGMTLIRNRVFPVLGGMDKVRIDAEAAAQGQQS